MKRPWAIWYASIIHLVWGALLLINKAPFMTNAIGFFSLFFDHVPAAILFITVAILALISYRAKHKGLEFILLMPQQIVLLFSTISGIFSAINGHYIDGVVRPGLFIFADQFPIILLGIMYTLNMFDRFGALGNA